MDNTDNIDITSRIEERDIVLADIQDGAQFICQSGVIGRLRRNAAGGWTYVDGNAETPLGATASVAAAHLNLLSFCPVRPAYTSLDQLYRAVQASEQELHDSLPTWGPAPSSTMGVWSWDATRLLTTDNPSRTPELIERPQLRYTACSADGGEPWLSVDGNETVATLEGLRARVEGASIAGQFPPHLVTLGTVEVEDGQIYWSTWQMVDTVWAGGVEGDKAALEVLSTLSTTQILALQTEAGSAGDDITVEVCDEALLGDELARYDVAKIIADAQAQED